MEEGSMQDSSGHPFLRPSRLNTYTAYSIGSFIAWGVIWAIFAATAKKETLGYLLMFFIGWVSGWTSATIARVTYPPPKKRHSAGPRSFFQGYREN
jgi:hypothetical protein